MSIVVVGANHRTAPIELLERMVIPGDRLPKYLHALSEAPDVSEAVVLATCNRTEVYLVAERFHPAYAQIRDFFSDLTYLAPDEFAESLYTHYDEHALRHLFEVTAGLDSAVTGEHEILGQVKRAWEVAREEGTAHRSMNMVFRHALELGKRARTETTIAHHVTSVSQAAVLLAGTHFGGRSATSASMEPAPTDTASVGDAPCVGSVLARSLAGKRAVVLGAGSMAKGMASFLAAANVAEVVIANRTMHRAESLVETIKIQNDQVLIRAVGLEDLHRELPVADVLFSAARSDGHLIEREIVTSAMTARDELLIVDVGMPRNVDPGIAAVDGVTFLDMDDIAKLTDAGLKARDDQARAVHQIVDEELRRFESIVQAREVAPVITSLRALAESLRIGELERQSNRLGDLSATQMEAVDAVTKAVLAKLLHDPSVKLRDSAGSARGERLAESIRDLFDLD
ncbi:MAG: glutamyl-tRNA reductase [Microthrixaceae bacterium]